MIYRVVYRSRAKLRRSGKIFLEHNRKHLYEFLIRKIFYVSSTSHYRIEVSMIEAKVLVFDVEYYIHTTYFGCTNLAQKIIHHLLHYS